MVYYWFYLLNRGFFPKVTLPSLTHTCRHGLSRFFDCAVFVHECHNISFFILRRCDRCTPHVLQNDISLKIRQIGDFFCILYSNSWMDIRMCPLVKFRRTPIIVEQIMQKSSTRCCFSIATPFFCEQITIVRNTDGMLQTSGMNMLCVIR